MKNNNKSGFTLIEILIAITIFSIIMVSVFTIFIYSADINNKNDASRAMQENIKNVVETIAEDIRKNKIKGVAKNAQNCSLNFGTEKYLTGSKLCIETGNNNYFLGKKDSIGNWIRTENCDFGSGCSIVLNDTTNTSPISNSWIEFRNLSFTVSNTNPKRVTINFEAQPATGKGIKPELIKQNKIIFQTTISERLY